MIAGCAPALSLWARSAERWHPDLRVHWTYANSTDALNALSGRKGARGGCPPVRPRAGAWTTRPHVRRVLAGRAVVLVNIGLWEEGLLVAADNPRASKAAWPTWRKTGVRIVNREQGAGARLLLDTQLMQAENIPAASIYSGYDRIVTDTSGGGPCTVQKRTGGRRA